MTSHGRRSSRSGGTLARSTTGSPLDGPRSGGRPGQDCRTACPERRFYRSTPASREPDSPPGRTHRLSSSGGYNVFVVAARDLAVFSLGVFPDDAKGRRRAEDLTARLHAFLGGARMSYGEAGRALRVHPNSLPSVVWPEAQPGRSLAAPLASGVLAVRIRSHHLAIPSWWADDMGRPLRRERLDVR